MKHALLPAALALLAAPALAAEVNISAGAVRGATEAGCTEAVSALARRADALSAATSHPHDLVVGLRSFYDATYRLDAAGEARVLGQLSRVYVSGYAPDGTPREGVLETSFGMTVARPADAPAGAPAAISGTWNWLERTLEETEAATGRAVQRPLMHAFAWSGRMGAEPGRFGHAVSPCRAGQGGEWFGAVFVWTYRAG